MVGNGSTTNRLVADDAWIVDMLDVLDGSYGRGCSEDAQIPQTFQPYAPRPTAVLLSSRPNLYGHEVEFLQGLRFADTINGILSAFFASAILPTIGASWHGLYERDYQLLEFPKELNELVFSGTLKEAAGDTRAILRTPLGLRI